MLIAQASFEAAASRADVDLSVATRSLRGELRGIHALALAGLGHVRRAGEMADAALRSSIGVEAHISAHCALAVGALNQNQQDVALNHASEALRRAIYTGMIESFVSAYRGCPELLVCLLQERDQHAPLELVLTRAGDKQLVPASELGQERSVMSLSPREKGSSPYWRRGSQMPKSDEPSSSARLRSRFTCVTSMKSSACVLARQQRSALLSWAETRRLRRQAGEVQPRFASRGQTLTADRTVRLV